MWLTMMTLNTCLDFKLCCCMDDWQWCQAQRQRNIPKSVSAAFLAQALCTMHPLWTRLLGQLLKPVSTNESVASGVSTITPRNAVKLTSAGVVRDAPARVLEQLLKSASAKLSVASDIQKPHPEMQSN